ncbi:MAG: HEAT repeat domain-containing protein [Candidatus Eisenbacteria bacterium]
MLTDSRRVSEIATALSRAYKSRQLYNLNSPVPRTSIEQLLATMNSFLSIDDTLTFTVGEAELLYHGKAVYSNPDRRESLAFRMYRDGVRSITFHSGITIEEMLALLDALRPTGPQEDDDSVDVVTELWERELPHITYLAVDDCVEPDPSEEELAEANRRMSGQSAAVLDEVDGSMGVAMMTDLPLSDEERQSIANVSLCEEELDELGHEILADERTDVRERVAEIFLEILASPAGSDVGKDVARALEAMCSGLVHGGNLRHATNVLVEAKRLVAEETGLPEDTRGTLLRFLEARSSERELSALESMIEECSAHGLPVYEHYLRELLPGAVVPLCGMLGRLRNPAAKEMFCRVLSVLARENPEPVFSMLSDPRWYFVRSLVRILRLMKDRRSLIYLEGLLSHEDVRVRAEVVRCIADMGGKDAAFLLCRSLNDVEKPVRMLAAKKLGQLGESSSAPAISDSVLKAGFIQKDFDEKWEYLDALARTGKEESIPPLQRFLRKRSLFHIAELDETRKCAVAAILRVGTPRAMSILEELARKSRGRLRRWCLEALRLRNLSFSEDASAGDVPYECVECDHTESERRVGNA